MSNIENLRIFQIYSYTESEEAKERADATRFGEEYDEGEYRGLRPEVISSLLDEVGGLGDNPIMAGILFRAGVESPLATQYELYGTDYPTPIDSEPRLFGVYLGGKFPQVDSAPDALLLAQGYGRKAYRGHELVTTDFWSRSKALDVTNVRDARDRAQRAILSDYPRTGFLFVEQDTIIHELGGAEVRTVEGLGLVPEDYSEGYAAPKNVDRMARLENIANFDGQPELLEGLRDLYAALDPDVESIGVEGEDLYELRLNEAEITQLNKLHGLTGAGEITGLTMDREDRQQTGEFSKDGAYYTNGWGDMTIALNLEFEEVVRRYILRVYMDVHGTTNLQKYTTELRQDSTWLSTEAEHMLATIKDPLAEETEFNEIDEFEYQDLVKLVRNIKAVTTLS